MSSGDSEEARSNVRSNAYIQPTYKESSKQADIKGQRLLEVRGVKMRKQSLKYLKLLVAFSPTMHPKPFQLSFTPTTLQRAQNASRVSRHHTSPPLNQNTSNTEFNHSIRTIPTYKRKSVFMYV
ncbi:hypothetical protein ACFFRR_003947 [Megaselia abdita]